MIEKVGAAFILGIEILIFAMLPYFRTHTLTNKTSMQIFNSFSAGLFMGISFLHIIPEANQSISEWLEGKSHSHEHSQKEGHNHQIPYGTLISLITFLLVLFLQVYLNDGVSSGQSGGHHHHHHDIHERKKIQQSQKVYTKKRLTFDTYLMQLALSIHSLFECMSIGIEKNGSVALTLATAIVCHKWAEALTLGYSYLMSGMPKQTAFRFTLFHAFLNAGAVLLGHQLSHTNQLVKGITNGISGGTFIYICIIEKIVHQFEHKEGLLKKLCLVIGGLGFSLIILD